MPKKQIPGSAQDEQSERAMQPKLEERLDDVLQDLSKSTDTLKTVNTLKQLLRVHTAHCPRGETCDVAKALRDRLKRFS